MTIDTSEGDDSMSSTLQSLSRSESRDPRGLARRFEAVRRASEWIVEPLETEDFVVQSMADVSPAKWHLAHTTWFFETFVLAEFAREYRPFHPSFRALFNSYYNAIGAQFSRPDRGIVTRPTTREVFAYRAHVDVHVARLLSSLDDDTWRRVAPLIEIGLNHEQQHQELMLTDIKHVFACNPLTPVYRPSRGEESAEAPPVRWVAHAGGLCEVGHDGEGFAFDNEGPRHRVYLEPFEIASRLVTNAEYRAFLEEGGYERPEFWLSDGWNARRAEGWVAPLYWRRHEDGTWTQTTLGGEETIRAADPVCHVSFYEADAYARWAGARLPREEEWEVVAASAPVEGNLLEGERFHPAAGAAALPAESGTPNTSASPNASGAQQLFGDVWEWTCSPYVSYPGYRPPEGALGEYNAKFMCNQMVLRGGSCATPQSHVRATYRNFFPPPARWQFTGLRLARDVTGRGT
jgi:ergothioneine biosynthesis protein EgtB